MSKIAQVGDYCPNEECPDYGKLQTEQVKPNIKKSGFSQAGKQRFKCKTCQRTFTETKGTIFYRKRTPPDEIIDTLAWVAEGVRVSSHKRVKGHKEDTVIGWIREAAEHAEEIEEVLMAEYQITRGQLDGLWSYVSNKGEKKLP